jgi:4-amino-4-deoxy-L-arabinose transferase-like glycosyltransferase
LHSFSKKEFLVLAGAVILLLPALLLNLHIVPLYGEEPRRAVVAMEMLFRHNWLVPTVNGELYYLKPPFFNWILALLYTLTGNNSEFITRIPTIVSLLLLGLVMYTIGKKFVSRSFGALSALLFMTAAGNLFFNSLLAEIDLFYSLVTYTGLVCLFHFRQQGKYLLLFMTFYFLGAIGVLTKGAPSLVYTGLSLLVFFLVNREFKKLFSLGHLAGIFLFLIIIGGYFYAYSGQGDVIHYMKSLSAESGKRFSGDTLWDYLLQMAWFPVDTLLNLLPASLLLIFTIRKSFFRIIKSNPLLKFALLMLAIHFPVYWLPPGGRQRYIIMLYPFIIQILTYFYLEFLSTERPKLKFLTKIPRSALISLIFLMIIGRIIFDFTVLPVRASTGKSADNRKAALMLHEITKDGKLCVFSTTYFPMQCTYYIERERKEIVPRYGQVVPGSYHVVQQILLIPYSYRRDIGDLMENPLETSCFIDYGDTEDLFSGYDYRTILEFDLQKRPYLLVTPVHPHP